MWLHTSHRLEDQIYELIYDPSLLEWEIYDVLYPLHTQAQNNLEKYLPINQKPSFVWLHQVGIQYNKDRKKWFFIPTEKTYYSLYDAHPDGTIADPIIIGDQKTHTSSRNEMRFFVGKKWDQMIAPYIISTQKEKIIHTLLQKKS